MKNENVMAIFEKITKKSKGEECVMANNEYYEKNSKWMQSFIMSDDGLSYIYKSSHLEFYAMREDSFVCGEDALTVSVTDDNRYQICIRMKNRHPEFIKMDGTLREILDNVALEAGNRNLLIYAAHF